MAARRGRPLGSQHDERTRLKIKTSQIINRLADHVDNKCDMSTTQVRAAQILLNKTLPDLSSADINQNNSGEITIQIVRHGNKPA